MVLTAIILNTVQDIELFFRKIIIFIPEKTLTMKGFLYILLCSDGSYYTGSTNNLECRLAQHQSGKGANHTKKRLPVRLVYYEEYDRIDLAFCREKQIQGWSRRKKEALIKGMPELLPELAIAYRDLRESDA
ncbi:MULTISPECIES: GIY-YIG nuclease family protein [Chryseobacterium]|uniref:GIY-YIG nuclease family protein n=1 Tax=Chryseobacterium endophyticum TaxID=1854762 RepID=A0AAU6WLR0_9FLAO